MPLLPISSSSQSPTYVPGYVMVQTPYGLVPVSTTTTPQVTPKSEGDTTATDNTGTNTGGGGGGTSTSTTTTKPQSFEFTNAIGRMINRNLEPYQQGPAYTLPYGNYGPQFPNLGTQIGSAMYTNVQPRQYTPSWTVDRMPPRLGMRDTGEADPFSPYITGRKMGNYGQLFSKFGAAPQGPFGITPGGDGQQGPFGGGAYQNLTQPFNPFPLYAPYDPSKSLQVHSAPNPYLANQQGGTAYGGLGGLLMQHNAAAAAAPPGPTNKSLGVGGAPPPSGGGLDIQPGTTPGPGGYITEPGSDGVVHLLNYISQNPQLRGLLGF